MKEKIFARLLKHKELTLFFVLAFGSLLLSRCSSTPEKPVDIAVTEPDSIATFIPKGFSLVPLEISNYQTLDSILGPFGVVDLFAQDAMAKNFNRLVAKNIKLVRAPKNPSHFAALVPEKEIASLLRFAGPFFAVVQNPETTGTRFEKENKRSRSRIQYNLGE